MAGTMRITAMVVFILIGSRVFSLVFQGVDGGIWIEHLLTGLPGGQIGFLIVVNIFIFFLAFFLDFFEIAFIILPLLGPVAAQDGHRPDLVRRDAVREHADQLHAPALRLRAVLPARHLRHAVQERGAAGQGRIEGHLPGRDPVRRAAAGAGGDRHLRAADGDRVPGQGEGGRPRQGRDSDGRDPLARARRRSGHGGAASQLPDSQRARRSERPATATTRSARVCRPRPGRGEGRGSVFPLGRQGLGHGAGGRAGGAGMAAGCPGPVGLARSGRWSTPVHRSDHRRCGLLGHPDRPHRHRGRRDPAARALGQGSAVRGNHADQAHSCAATVVDRGPAAGGALTRAGADHVPDPAMHGCWRRSVAWRPAASEGAACLDRPHHRREPPADPA